MAVSPRLRPVIIVVAALAMIAGLLALRAALATPPLERLHAGVDGRSGSWFFPRGGPYILGFESSAPAELIIDGRQVVAGNGRVSERVIYSPGAHAVTFRGPKDTRLLWHPPGRRGALEYVPESSLSPAAPEQARFGGGAGASRRDGAIALAILLVIGAAGVLFARPRLPSREIRYAAGGVFALALIVRLIAMGAAGQTWDEDEYWSAGRNYVTNLLSLDFSEVSWRWNFEHPPVTKYLAGLGAQFTDGYGGARVVFALLGAAACALAADVARRLFGSTRAGVFAGVTCALTPHLIAHSTIVGHENPSVFFWTLAIWLAIRAATEPEALPRRLVWTGVALGLAIGTRFTNLLLAPVIGVTVLALTPVARWLRTALLGLAITPAAAAVTFFAVWPRMWTQPIVHLRESWEKLKLPHSEEPFLGVFTSKPGWHYFPVYVLVTAPLLILAAAWLLGALRGATRREKGWFVLLAWLAAPFGVAWSPVRQDGVRYVLPLLVPLSIAAGAGVDWLADRVRRPWAGQAAGALLGAYLVVTCARIHPYYLDYYGEHVGGPATARANRWFEVGWWGEGIGEAVAYVNRHAAVDDPVYRLLEPSHVNWFRVDLWRSMAGSPSAARWIVVNDAGIFSNDVRYKRPPFRVPPGFTIAHVVRAQGAPLVTIYRRD